MLVLLALVILLASIAIGYVAWIKPLESELDVRSKAALLFIVLTLFGAFWGSMPWWFDADASFAWDLPPLASRMLGAAGFAFVVGCLFTLVKPSYDKLRLMLVMIGVYMLPITAAILAFHLDRFDFGEPVVWGFFPLVVIMCSATMYFLVNTPVIGQRPTATADQQAPIRIWLVAVATITLLWGFALFVTDDGFSKDIWAWPGDLLSSRLIAVMLLTLASAAIFAIVYPSTSRMALSVIAVYGLAGSLANIWQDFLDKPVNHDYVGVLGLIGVVSCLLLVWPAASRSITRAQGQAPS